MTTTRFKQKDPRLALKWAQENDPVTGNLSALNVILADPYVDPQSGEHKIGWILRRLEGREAREAFEALKAHGTYLHVG